MATRKLTAWAMTVASAAPGADIWVDQMRKQAGLGDYATAMKIMGSLLSPMPRRMPQTAL